VGQIRRLIFWRSKERTVKVTKVVEMTDYSQDPRYKKLHKVLADTIRTDSFAHWLAYIACLQDDKDHDYSGLVPFSNFRGSETIGIPASLNVFLRITDKFYRISNYFQQRMAHVRDDIEPELKVGESVIETSIDQAVYYIILACMLSEEERNVERYETRR
jgi:hypothetical protein